MTEPENSADPRDVDDADLATQDPPPLPGEDTAVPDPVVEDEYAEGLTHEPGGAERDAPAGEDYAGSGF